MFKSGFICPRSVNGFSALDKFSSFSIELFVCDATYDHVKKHADTADIPTCK